MTYSTFKMKLWRSPSTHPSTPLSLLSLSSNPCNLTAPENLFASKARSSSSFPYTRHRTSFGITPALTKRRIASWPAIPKENIDPIEPLPWRIHRFHVIPSSLWFREAVRFGSYAIFFGNVALGKIAGRTVTFQSGVWLTQRHLNENGGFGHSISATSFMLRKNDIDQ